MGGGDISFYLKNISSFDLFGDVTFHFHYVRRVTSFSRNKTTRITCKCLCYIQSSWRDFFSCYGEKWKHLKDTLAFSSFLVC